MVGLICLYCADLYKHDKGEFGEAFRVVNDIRQRTLVVLNSK